MLVTLQGYCLYHSFYALELANREETKAVPAESGVFCRSGNFCSPFSFPLSLFSFAFIFCILVKI
jgi:hypothetical protein